LSEIYAIVTHHLDPRGAAEAWKRERVCAIGWAENGSLRKVPSKAQRGRFRTSRHLFLGIRKGNLILAYAKGNMIAYVGEVVRGYRYTKKNDVGNEENGFDYPNQLGVKWWRQPHHFDRHELPDWLKNQLGPRARGKTVIKLDLGKFGFLRTIQIIKTNVVSKSGLTEFEDVAKAGLRKYLGERIDKLEEGLVMERAERSTSETDRPDFIAIDSRNRTVLIECKGTAYEKDCDQLSGYGQRHVEKKPRLMLVAFRFDEACRKLAKQKGIELIECDLNVTRI